MTVFARALVVLTLIIALIGCSTPPATAPAASANASAPVHWTGTYLASTQDPANGWWGTQTCGTQLGLDGYEPAAPGTYPVLIFLVGYLADYTAPDSWFQEMAARGFVVASVQFQSGIGEDDGPPNDGRPRCLFDSAYNASSVIAEVLQRPKADASKGIVVMGHSEGGSLALMARNYDSRVRAAVSLSMAASWPANADPARGGTRQLLADRIRLVTGATDSVVSLDQINALLATGYSQGGHLLQPDGSGWYQVQTSEVSPAQQTASGAAGHCFFSIGGCTSNYDPLFMPASQLPWSLDAQIDWLLSFTG